MVIFKINIIKLTYNTAHTKTGVGLNLEKPIRTSIWPTVAYIVFQQWRYVFSSFRVWEEYSIVSGKG